MTPRALGAGLLLACLLHPAASLAEVAVDTETLRLRFSDSGELLSGQACFPVCEAGGRRVLLSGRVGLSLEPPPPGPLRLARERREASTVLSFSDGAGRPLRVWQVPDRGWKLALRSAGPGAATLSSGVDFRPAPSSGFGSLLERSRYLLFDGSTVEGMDLDADAPALRASLDWSGFRNRFWAVLLRPAQPVSIALQAGEGLEDARLEVSPAGRPAGLELEMYLGPVEPSALSQSSPELEGLMYSGLWFWLRWICQALHALLDGIRALLPQWGLAIMALSFTVGILMRPLTAVAERLQNQVHETDARLAPELAAIRKNHKGEERSEKTIALYRQAGVHPLYSLKSLAGVFIVVPVFIGAFDMLAENIHLAGEPFLWIADLSRPDAFMPLPVDLPFFGAHLNLLPFVMTGFSLLASALHSHPTMDAARQGQQARKLALMSLGFLVLFYTFPAGMVLYWTTNNLAAVVRALWRRRKAE